MRPTLFFFSRAGLLGSAGASASLTLSSSLLAAAASSPGTFEIRNASTTLNGSAVASEAAPCDCIMPILATVGRSSKSIIFSDTLVEIVLTRGLCDGLGLLCRLGPDEFDRAPNRLDDESPSFASRFKENLSGPVRAWRLGLVPLRELLSREASLLRLLDEPEDTLLRSESDFSSGGATPTPWLRRCDPSRSCSGTGTAGSSAG